MADPSLSDDPMPHGAAGTAADAAADNTARAHPAGVEPAAAAALAQWHAAAARSAPDGDVGALGWHTPDGIHIKALYTAADVAGLPHTGSLPGFAPYLRESIFGGPGGPRGP